MESGTGTLGVNRTRAYKPGSQLKRMLKSYHRKAAQELSYKRYCGIGTYTLRKFTLQKLVSEYLIVINPQNTYKIKGKFRSQVTNSTRIDTPMIFCIVRHQNRETQNPNFRQTL